MKNKKRKERSGYSHDCPYCGYHIVVCTSPKYLKCIYCCRRWKLEAEYEDESFDRDPDALMRAEIEMLKERGEH